MLRWFRWSALFVGTVAVASCLPADEAVGLGSVQFAFTSSGATKDGVVTADGWSLRFDRVVLGFKSMTIGEVGVANVCSYRGRGAVFNLVFDPRVGIEQTFNGIQPVECPDVGVIFMAPISTTTLGGGATPKDLVDLASGEPAHAIIEATATRRSDSPRFGDAVEEARIHLRFGNDVTSSRFGGCRTAKERGVSIAAAERDHVSVRFAAENLFRPKLSDPNYFLVDPLLRADGDRFGGATRGNRDGVVTMDELDLLPVSTLSFAYEIPDEIRRGTVGDLLRLLFRFTLGFRENGTCVGNPPGAEEDGAPNE